MLTREREQNNEESQQITLSEPRLPKGKRLHASSWAFSTRLGGQGGRGVTATQHKTEEVIPQTRL